MYPFLHDHLLVDFFELLHGFGELHAPVASNGLVSWRRVSTLEEVALDYGRTLIPPKKYLLPATEKLLNYGNNTGYAPVPVEHPPLVLFGLHPCDLAGIAYLDRAFLHPSEDPWYRGHRDRLTLVGISCIPDQYCSCTERIFGANDGADIFLQRMEQGYLLHRYTDTGERIAKAAQALLGKSRIPAPVRERTRTTPYAPPEEPCRPVEAYAGSTLWDRFAGRCLSCGACSACCPTCSCFSLREHGSLDGATALRSRDWDNCLFASHGMVADGTNFRPTRRERLQYRFRHKYFWFCSLRGTSSCVGCGRCRVICPVGIDLRDILQEQTGLLEETE